MRLDRLYPVLGCASLHARCTFFTSKLLLRLFLVLRSGTVYHEPQAHEPSVLPLLYVADTISITDTRHDCGVH